MRASQLRLLDAALRGAPIPHRNIHSCGGGRAEIGNSVRTVHSKLRGVDSVPIIETKRGQIAGARAGDVLARLLHRGQRGAKIGIVASGALLHFCKGWQRNTRMKIFGKFKIIVEVGKDQHCKIEPGIQKPKLRLQQLPMAVLHLQFRLNDVGVRDFSSSFEVLGQF